MRKKETQQVMVITPDGSKPAVPVHTPMFGPGSRPEEKPKKDWLSRFKPAIVSVAILFVVAGLVGYAHFDDPPQQNIGSRKVADDDYKYGNDGAVLSANTSLDSDDQTTPTATKPGTTPSTKPKPSPTPGGAAKANPSTQPTPANSTPVTPSPGPSPVPTPSPLPAPTPKTVAISHSGSGYSPAAVKIYQGDTVVITNNGLVPMWPACSDGSCDAGGPVAAGGSWSYTFNNPGTWVIQNKAINDLLGGSVTVNVLAL